MRHKVSRRKPVFRGSLPTQTKPLPYHCAILTVPPGLDYWGTYSTTLCDAKAYHLPFFGCRLYPFWQHQPDNDCRPKFVPLRRSVIFAVSEPFPPLSTDGVIIVSGGLETAKKILESGACIELFRNQDVRLPLRQPQPNAA